MRSGRNTGISVTQGPKEFRWESQELLQWLNGVEAGSKKQLNDVDLYACGIER